MIKRFNIAKNEKYDGYQHGLASMVYNFFGKIYSGGAVTHADKFAIKNKIILNEQLAEELHKRIIKKFQKCKVYSSFKENIWHFDLGGMQLISKCNK